MIYDSQVLPGCHWTDAHFAQGFVRREGVVCFRTLLHAGKANVNVIQSDYIPGDYERVIRCPLLVLSGSVWIAGPEEWPEPDDHRVELAPGLWTVTCGQILSSADKLEVTVWFSNTALTQSQIFIADSEIHPPAILIESGEIP